MAKAKVKKANPFGVPPRGHGQKVHTYMDREVYAGIKARAAKYGMGVGKYLAQLHLEHEKAVSK